MDLGHLDVVQVIGPDPAPRPGTHRARLRRRRRPCAELLQPLRQVRDGHGPRQLAAQSRANTHATQHDHVDDGPTQPLRGVLGYHRRAREFASLFGRTTPPESHAMMATRMDGERISEIFATHLPLTGDGLGRIGTGGGGNGPPSHVEGTPRNSLIGVGIDGSRRDLTARGAGRIRTADGGFADLCLATWLRRRCERIILLAGTRPDNTAFAAIPASLARGNPLGASLQKCPVSGNFRKKTPLAKTGASRIINETFIDLRKVMHAGRQDTSG